MRCGARKYQAEFIKNKNFKRKEVIARTPAEARKILRSTYGRDIEVLSVVKDRRNE